MKFVIAHHRQKQISPQKQTHKWYIKLLVNNSKKAEHILQILTHRLQKQCQRQKKQCGR